MAVNQIRPVRGRGDPHPARAFLERLGQFQFRFQSAVAIINPGGLVAIDQEVASFCNARGGSWAAARHAKANRELAVSLPKAYAAAIAIGRESEIAGKAGA